MGVILSHEFSVIQDLSVSMAGLRDAAINCDRACRVVISALRDGDRDHAQDAWDEARLHRRNAHIFQASIEQLSGADSNASAGAMAIVLRGSAIYMVALQAMEGVKR